MNTYYKIRSAEEPDKELFFKGKSGGFNLYDYRFEGGDHFENKEEAFQLARENMGVVIEINERILGGWGFIFEDGSITHKRYDD